MTIASPRTTTYRLLPLPAIAVITLAVVGYLPTRSWVGAGGLEAMLAAQGLVLAVVYATLVPGLRRMAAADKPTRLRIGLTLGVVRLLLTIALAAVMVLRELVDRSTFLIWLAIAYVVLIQVETWALIHWTKTLDKRI